MGPETVRDLPQNVAGRASPDEDMFRVRCRPDHSHEIAVPRTSSMRLEIQPSPLCALASSHCQCSPPALPTAVASGPPGLPPQPPLPLPRRTPQLAAVRCRQAGLHPSLAGGGWSHLKGAQRGVGGRGMPGGHGSPRGEASRLRLGRRGCRCNCHFLFHGSPPFWRWCAVRQQACPRLWPAEVDVVWVGGGGGGRRGGKPLIRGGFNIPSPASLFYVCCTAPIAPGRTIALLAHSQ